ncbi:hypothetical protein NBRC116589_23800 [Ruegeria sp. HU-ET01832]
MIAVIMQPVGLAKPRLKRSQIIWSIPLRIVDSVKQRSLLWVLGHSIGKVQTYEKSLYRPNEPLPIKRLEFGAYANCDAASRRGHSW